MDNPGFNGLPSKLPPIGMAENGLQTPPAACDDVKGSDDKQVTNGAVSNGNVTSPEEMGVATTAEDERTYHDPFFYARWITNYPKTCFCK